MEKKCAIVTGASRGIGRAIAERFAQEGAIVYANARQTGSIDQWAGQLSNTCPGTIIPQYYDVTSSSDCKAAVMQVRKEQKKLDILVNNAGLMSNGLLASITQATLCSLFSTNVFAPIFMMQLASRLMVSQKGGSIINIASIVGERGNRGQIAYSATKGAIIALTKSAAKELAPYNIRVNAVAPGLTNTDALDLVAAGQIDGRVSGIGLGRVAEPADIANACVFLASDLSCYVSGDILDVNGCAVM